MIDNYQKIARNNLNRLYAALPPDLATRLGARREHDDFIFDAFGDECRLTGKGIQLGAAEIASVPGVIVSLYALHAQPETALVEPMQSFKEIPDSMPYWGAFASHTEQVLTPYVAAIGEKVDAVCRAFRGNRVAGGDFAFDVYPLPKIALRYIFYRADEEFPATVNCLFSRNAHAFLPVDGLADLGEYSSKKIMAILQD
ncbi:MAG: DUF3786 domain-containing protein [Desulfobulbaceae bacterium]|jgi:hypothetical protein|nr:DUF3786 domain-containing protein [Desulfobulbaceae bacterium]